MTLTQTKSLFLCDETYRAGDDEVRLWVKIAAEHIVAMTFQSLQAFALKQNMNHKVSI